VRGLFTTLKKIFFWNYARNTWQWDLLCVVILMFIFLTPPKWFANGERAQSMVHQSPVAKTLVLAPEVVGNEEDKGQIERQVKALTGRADVEVLAVRRIVDPEGRTRSFEVDIR
jgi:L-asparagine transporter-like permease